MGRVIVLIEYSGCSRYGVLYVAISIVGQTEHGAWSCLARAASIRPVIRRLLASIGD